MGLLYMVVLPQTRGSPQTWVTVGRPPPLITIINPGFFPLFYCLHLSLIETDIMKSLKKLFPPTKTLSRSTEYRLDNTDFVFFLSGGPGTKTYPPSDEKQRINLRWPYLTAYAEKIKDKNLTDIQV